MPGVAPNVQATPDVSDAANRWDRVDDFKWLKATPSPHWRLLAGSEGADESVWTDLVPGGSGRGLKDILRAAGVVDEG